MSLGAIVVPAVVGYWLLRRTHYFKPAVARTPSYAFAFFCASVGILAGALALGFTRLIHVLVHPEPAAWFPWWQAQLSFEDPSTATVMILFAVTASSVVNHLIPEQDVARKWLVPEEGRVNRALRESYEKRRVVEVVTGSGDSYIGLIVGERYPWEWGDDVAIVPVAIGYRDEGTRALTLTSVRQVGARLDEVEVVSLPRTSVTSVTTFAAHGIGPRPEGAQTDVPPPEETLARAA